MAFKGWDVQFEDEVFFRENGETIAVQWIVDEADHTAVLRNDCSAAECRAVGKLMLADLERRALEKPRLPRA